VLPLPKRSVWNQISLLEKKLLPSHISVEVVRLSVKPSSGFFHRTAEAAEWSDLLTVFIIYWLKKNFH